MRLINITFNDICLHFDFINGSITEHVFIQFSHFESDALVDQLVYKISRNDRLSFTECISNIPAGSNWTLYAYDAFNCSPATSNCNPAVVIANINVPIEPSSSLLTSNFQLACNSTNLFKEVSSIPSTSIGGTHESCTETNVNVTAGKLQ